MNRKMLLAGAAGALLLGSVAVAQTAGSQGQTPSATPGTAASSAPSSTTTTTSPDGMNAQTGATTSQAPAAGQYGADTAAQAGDTSGAAMSDDAMRAGERG
jgi:hypothetical protein